MMPVALLKRNIGDSIRAKQILLRDPDEASGFERAVNLVTECYRLGSMLYIAGKGGLATDAQHLAAEFVSKLARDRNTATRRSLDDGQLCIDRHWKWLWF